VARANQDATPAPSIVTAAAEYDLFLINDLLVKLMKLAWHHSRQKQIPSSLVREIIARGKLSPN
jgi:hypothetical protein